MKAWEFIVRRLLLLIPVLIGVTIITFTVSHVIPADPARAFAGGPKAQPDVIERITRELHLNEPIWVQYFDPRDEPQGAGGLAVSGEQLDQSAGPNSRKPSTQPVPTDASGRPVPTDAPGLPVPTDASGLPVPTDAPGLPVPTDASGLPVPTDASGLPVPTDAPGFPVPTDASGRPVPTEAPG